jgi:hypothetical protein
VLRPPGKQLTNLLELVQYRRERFVFLSGHPLGRKEAELLLVTMAKATKEEALVIDSPLVRDKIIESGFTPVRTWGGFDDMEYRLEVYPTDKCVPTE